MSTEITLNDYPPDDIEIAFECHYDKNKNSYFICLTKAVGGFKRSIGRVIPKKNWSWLELDDMIDQLDDELDRLNRKE